MKKEKTIRTYQRRTKTGKVVTVKQHTAKYDAAEALKEAAKKKGAGDELEALKKKKPVAQKEEVKSPYEEYGFTKDDFKEWYEGTGSKADKKVEKALKKAMGTKAYNALSDKAADEYKKGGAHRFFTKGLEEMKASTSASTKSVTPTKETKGSKETLVEHYDQFNKKYQGKAVGKPFQFKEKGSGITYDAQFVTDGRGKYGYVVRDSEDSDKRFYVSTDEATKLSELEPGVRKAAKAAGLTLKKGVWTAISGGSTKETKTPKAPKSSKSVSKEPEDLGSPKGQRFEYKYGKYIITKEGQVFTSTGKKVSKKMTSNILAARENAKKMSSRGKKSQHSAASDDTTAFKAFLKLPKPEKGSKGYAVHMALRSAARWGGASDDTLRDALVRNGYPSKDAYSKGIKEVIALAKKHKITL